MAGLQMEFVENIEKNYKILDIDNYKIAIEEELLKDNDFFEIKYSNNFIAKGFYVSKKE